MNHENLEEIFRYRRFVIDMNHGLEDVETKIGT